VDYLDQGLELATATGMPLQRCVIALEAAMGNLDYAFEILTTF
jgi:translation elongation factor EF-Ts